MKTTWKLIVFVFTFLALTASAYAQSPREQLNQIVQQLQQTPTDNALREKIIKLSTSIKPAPAIPEEALRREGRAKFAFKNAKSNDDYLGAAREYEEAVRVAPWVSGYYLDLCTIYEKAEKYAEAKRNCQLSLIGLSEPSQVNEVKQRIAGLEFGLEKAIKENSPEARAAKEKEAEQRFIASLEGAVFTYVNTTDTAIQYRIKNGRADIWTRRTGYRGSLCYDGSRRDGPIGEEVMCPDGTGAGRLTIPLNGRHGEFEDNPGYKTTIDISEDGQSLRMKQTKGWDGKPKEYLFTRR